MYILVINCGSSSIKAAILDVQSENPVFTLRVDRVMDNPTLSVNNEPRTINGIGHAALLKEVLPIIAEQRSIYPLLGVGHRVVHGGDSYDRAIQIDQNVEETIQQLSSLAPLHNPVNVLGIKIARSIFTDIPHVAIFDTAFHQSIPRRASTYAIDQQVADRFMAKRFGFHGTSHSYVAKKASEYLDQDLDELRIISCHLGNGASVCAIEYGRSVETSMGMTPLEGLVMGTRSGDVDPGMIIHLAKELEMNFEELDQWLNKKSGLLGLSGDSHDMRDIIDRSTQGDDTCRLALQVFTHRLRKYIGAYTAVMGGVDAIIFTGGIGENSPVVRHRVCQRLDYLGARIDEDLNMDVQLGNGTSVVDFSTSSSRVRLLAIQTDEQLEIAKQAYSVVNKQGKVNTKPTIPIAVSARHIHLTQDAVDILFGEGYQLTKKAPLSQPNQYACNEQVTIIGPKNKIERVRILGPTRSKNQLEISRTDEFFLGIDAPVRASGKVENTPGIKLSGPAGDLTIQEGVICAWRHIHMTPEDAIRFGVQDKDVVDVEVNQGLRPLTFGNVLVRVSPKYALEMHIDTDEANAAELPRFSEGVLNKTNGTATLLTRKR